LRGAEFYKQIVCPKWPDLAKESDPPERWPFPGKKKKPGGAASTDPCLCFEQLASVLSKNRAASHVIELLD
jgi:hypothetical protein